MMRRKSKSGRQRRGGVSIKPSSGSLLARFDEASPLKAHLRFEFNSSAGKIITAQNLCQLLICRNSVGSGTGAASLYDVCKINRIRIVDTAGGLINIQWYAQASGTVGTGMTREAVGNAIYPSIIDMTPPPGSQAALNLGNVSGTNVMAINGQSSSTYVDLWITVFLDGGGTTLSTTSTMSAPGLYYNALDGSSGVIRSQGANPIF